MFGFINIYKNELKIKDYNLFRAYYCGLCKSLGKRYSQAVRLGLSYDLTFLCILADSLNEECHSIKKEGCIKHLGMHMICTDSKAIDFASDMSILLFYHKLCDDIKDDKSPKALLFKIPYIRPARKATRRHPEIAQSIKDNLCELSRLEKEKCPSIDMAAHPFAMLTARVFEGASPELRTIGYNIGRFIYIADAFKDIEDDRKNNSYNPFLCMGEEYLNSMDFKSRVRGTFNMTLTAIANEYSKLKIKKNKDLLDNIIYLGLQNASEELFKKTEEENDRSI